MPAVTLTAPGPAAGQLAALLAGRETLRAPLDAAAAGFSARHGDMAGEIWAEGALALLTANAGAGALLAYARLSEAGDLGPSALRAAADGAVRVCRAAGGRAAEVTLDAFARLLPAGEAVDFWAAFARLAEGAPDEVAPFAARAGQVWRRGEGAAFRHFVETGLKAAGRSAARRRAFFTLDDPLALGLVARLGAALGLEDMDGQLRRVLLALWGGAPQLQALPPPPPGTAQRVNIAGPVLRLPAAWPGLDAKGARHLYLASAVHAGAHLFFGNPRFQVGKDKPVQIALATLVEDARIEHLALRLYPGLRRLWAPYHRASAEDGPTVHALLARVARGLFDPAYRDPDALVEKAQALFADAAGRLDDPAISREIGTRLANDVSQRRLRFDARGHVVEPAYRDDGLGLWDFSQVDPEVTAEVEMMVEAARLERREGEDGKPDAPPSPSAGRARPVSAAAEGVTLATYPEWDAQAGIERPDWVTVKAMAPVEGDARALRRALDEAAPLRARIARLVMAAKLGRPSRLTRQSEGHELDIDAVIAEAIARRAGEVPELRVFRSSVLTRRDLAVLVLIDISQSTRDRLAGGHSVLDVEKLAVALLAEALAALGDRFALMGFASNGRGEVRVHPVKGFHEPWEAEGFARLAGLGAGLSTRLGAALRHAGAEIARVPSFRKLVLVLTDGEPSDIDATPADLAADARRAVLLLRARGIDSFGVTLAPAGAGSEGPSAAAIFGKAHVLPIHRIEDLPARLSDLYFRLARR
ncbi:nitric oxide reductase activation protein NorD [Ancylobacter sp. SL191]|uniref:nitric oxide reductase activation protein NorD n=1 Tax=Ancylobacter sp. SL191 TaxID=2995166 RepID=UPI00226ECA34|nr:VWA domain-containing protein [Ancylobacter sp. SL191]WAC28806.1 VWA domain-containing protein [Ancylobacter sp. SL191]